VRVPDIADDARELQAAGDVPAVWS
jgi:hypothetical protein